MKATGMNDNGDWKTKPRLEPLIDRLIGFRLSTFDALKTYQRDQQQATGLRLTNGEVVDQLLRAQLSRLSYEFTYETDPVIR